MNPPTEATPPAAPAAAGKRHDLEIKDAQLIFDAIWADAEAVLGREHLRFPKEIRRYR